MNAPLLQATGITKSFHGISVLRGVELRVQAGNILGLVGENGAGKSTLMNIVGGNLRPDDGAMQISGQPYAPRTPRAAQATGIAFIHQELNLFANLSIAENIFLTRFPRTLWGAIDRRAMYRQTTRLLEQVGLPLAPNQLVENLSAGERQLVEIAKALQLEPRLMILDEPTTSLTIRETERLFELLSSLRTNGMGLLYISHALADIQRLCDEVVVLRDGAVVGSGNIEDFDTRRLISLMVGRECDNAFPPRTRLPDLEHTQFDVQQVTQPGVVRNITFQLHRGEVLGISGLMGSGRTELARILFGLDSCEHGQISLCGQRIEHLSTAARVERGLAMLTESRRDDGLCMLASILENMTLVAEPRFARNPLGVLNRAALGASVQELRTAVQMNPHVNLQKPVQTLSGGNQQKVALAKWLLNQPQVLILDEPTRGIDVGAKFEIYGLIDRLAAEGMAILVISSEIEELLGLCDRILVMSRGEIRDEMERSEFDQKRIMRSSLHGHRLTEGAP